MKNRFNFYVSKHDLELLEFLNNYGTGFNQYICNLIKRDLSNDITLQDIMSKLNQMQFTAPKIEEIDKNNEEFEFNDILYEFSSDDF